MPTLRKKLRKNGNLETSSSSFSTLCFASASCCNLSCNACTWKSHEACEHLFSKAQFMVIVGKVHTMVFEFLNLKSGDLIGGHCVNSSTLHQYNIVDTYLLALWCQINVSKRNLKWMGWVELEISMPIL